MSTRARQNGAALMVMCVILVLATCWWLVSTFAANFDRTALDREHNARMLSRAKHALVGYIAQKAATDDHPGRPPCPEADGDIGDAANEGRAAPNCVLPAVGRLPWRTLGIDKLVDAAGEPLWYVVSPGWRVSAGTLVLNSNTAGQLSVDGVANAAAALVIAPGAPVLVAASANCSARQQARALPAPGMDFRNYLECQNASATSSFATSGPAGSFNDQVLAVSAQDIWGVAEGAVAARFNQQVQPAMDAVLSAPYVASPQWGAGLSATNPMLPFAGMAFPDNSTFPNQGGVPLWRSQGCTAGTDPLCDPAFVQWDLTPLPSLVKRSGSANILSANCTASTGNEVSCTVRYGGVCGGGLGFLLGGVCRHTMEASVLGSAEKVGNAVRAFSSAGITGFTLPLVSSDTPIDASGNANADIRGNLPQPECNTTIVLGLLIPCWAEETVTVRVPITAFADHPALTAFFASAATQWYLNNRWYELTYYAVAPRHSPAGATPHDCRPLSCLSVTGGNLPADVRAVVALTGQSLNGAARPNTTPGDYLDSLQNTDGNLQFEQKLAGRSFNDRFFAVSKY
jgi:hypothetical protein